MKQYFFKTLAVLNKWLLPKVSKLDLNRLSTFDKALIAYKYWVTTRSLE